MIITIKHFQLSHIRCVHRTLVYCVCRITQRQIPIFDIIILFEFLHAYAMSDKINLHMNRILFSNVSFSISCCRYLATKDGFVRVHKQHSCTAMHIAPMNPIESFSVVNHALILGNLSVFMPMALFSTVYALHLSIWPMDSFATNRAFIHSFIGVRK